MGNVIYLSGRASRATILLVESQPLMRIATAAFLRERELIVVEAIDGAEALRFLRAGRLVHLVSSAVDLSGAIPGLALAEVIGREFPEVKIVMNGHAPESSPFPRLRRPYDPPELESVIRRSLGLSQVAATK